MRTRLIRIGDARGVRLPQSVIEKAQLDDELEVEVVGGAVVIRGTHGPRDGWSEAAGTCAAAEDDRFEDWDVLTDESWDGRE